MTAEDIRKASRAYREANIGLMPGIGAAVCRRITELSEYKTAGTVFAFCSLPTEPDMMSLLMRILADGKTLCLPRCTGDGLMKAIKTDDLLALKPGAFGIPEPPKNGGEILPQAIDLAVIPCSACGRDGSRIGKGGGYYDRFLEGFTGVTAAVCCHQLLYDALPQQPHDIGAGIIVTEHCTLRSF